MKVATSIQERLWELRKDKGLNLEELSKLTGISKSALGSYEKEDYKEINHGNLITLADFYGITSTRLFKTLIPPTPESKTAIDIIKVPTFFIKSVKIGRASCRERV